MRSMATVVVLLVGVAIFYIAVIRDFKFSGEEHEIKAVLESLYQSEMVRFKEKQSYTDALGEFELKETKRPTLIGAYPDCNSQTTILPHMFLGPADSTFKSQARAVIERFDLKGKCSNFNSDFTVFAAQDLDGDHDLELWTMDSEGEVKVLLKD